jgi:hypothetical protein
MARVIRACPFLSLPSSASRKLSDFLYSRDINTISGGYSGFFHNSPRPPAKGRART